MLQEYVCPLDSIMTLANGQIIQGAIDNSIHEIACLCALRISRSLEGRSVLSKLNLQDKNDSSDQVRDEK